VLALAILVVASAVLVAGTVWVNPQYQFTHRPPVAPPDWNEAAHKRYRFEQQAQPPGVVVVGSSRVMRLDPDDFGRGPGFNFGLSGSSLDDQETVLRYVLARGAPAVVVIGLDPNRLTVGQTLRRPIMTPLAFGVLHGGAAGPLDEVGAALRAYRYGDVRDAAAALWIEGGGPDPTPISIAADGTIDYGSLLTQDRAKRLDVHANVERELLGMAVDQPYPGLDAGATAHLASFVATARAAGSDIWLVMLPFHPAFIAAAQGPAFLDRQAAVHGWMAQRCGTGIRAFDYTDIASFGGQPDAFLDLVHIAGANAPLVAHAMAAGTGDLCAANPS
jgi:hypothetical protein